MCGPNAILSAYTTLSVAHTHKHTHTHSNALRQLHVSLNYMNLFIVHCFFPTDFVFLPDTGDWLAGCVGWLCVGGSRVAFCFDQERCGVQENLSSWWGTPCSICKVNDKSKNCLCAHDCAHMCMWLYVWCDLIRPKLGHVVYREKWQYMPQCFSLTHTHPDRGTHPALRPSLTSSIHRWAYYRSSGALIYICQAALLSVN